MDVVTYLASKGLRGLKTSGPEVVYPCFLGCQEDASSRKRKLYVNSTTGMYECKVCGEAGGTTLLQRHFGDDPKSEVALPAPGRRADVLEAAATLATEMLTGNEEMMLYLLNRGLTPETIVERRLGFVAPQWSLVGNLPGGFTRKDLEAASLVYRDGPRSGTDFFTHHLIIPYLERGRVVALRGRSMSGTTAGRYMTGPGDDVRLYNADDIEFCEEVIVTEGEFDAMILRQQLALSPEPKVRKMGVVGLPGAKVYPGGGEGFKRMLEETKKVWIGFDSDEAGLSGAVKLKDLLGNQARILEWPEETLAQARVDRVKKLDWTEVFTRYNWTWREVQPMLSAASGRRLFSVAEAGSAYRAVRNGTPGLKTGFVRLDETIEPGVLPGQLFVVLAKTGTGKTLFLCNLAYNMRHRGLLFISLEMTREEVYERLERIYYFHHPRATLADLESAYERIRINDENRLSEKDLEQLISDYEEEMGFKPEVIFVDYLGYYARGAQGGSPYEKTSNAVMQLKAEAKKHRVAIFSPHQVNRGADAGKPLDIDDARDSGVIEETADFLGALWRPDDALTTEDSQFNGKLMLKLLKSRHGGKDKAFPLQMAALSLAIVDAQTSAARKAERETWDYNRGLAYAEIRARETAPIQMTTDRRDLA